jgi:hypothetical protein
VESLVHAGQQEVHRPQAEDGEHVRGEHDERVGGDGEDGRDRVDGEDDVDDADQHDHHEQGRGHLHAVDDREELLAVVAGRDLHPAAHPFERRIALQVGLLAGGPPHLDAGEDQERAEQVEDPVELRDQPGAEEDHRRAQQQRAEDADHQHPLLELRRHGEIGEQHQEDEDVVHRQRLLDQVAGDELQRLGVGHLARRGIGAGSVQVPPQPADEDERDRDPDQRPDRRLPHRDAVRALPVQGEKVDQQGDENKGRKKRPHQRRADADHGELPFVWSRRGPW